MGFMDKFGEAVGKGIKARNDYMQNEQRRADAAYDRAGGMSDKELINKYKNSSHLGDKAGYAKELRDRGYGNNN